jgi:hypothetical protein
MSFVGRRRDIGDLPDFAVEGDIQHTVMVPIGDQRVGGRVDEEQAPEVGRQPAGEERDFSLSPRSGDPGTVCPHFAGA